MDPIGNSMTLSCVQGKTSGQIGDVTLGHDEDLNWIFKFECWWCSGASLLSRTILIKM